MEAKCLNCGEEIEVKEKCKPKLYCSGKCAAAYHYENREIHSVKPECISKCDYCGAEFDNYNNRSRKYCCHEHYIAARFQRLPAGPARREAQAARNSKLEYAMRLKDEGYGCKRIANELGISINIVKSWLRRYWAVKPAAPEPAPELQKESTHEDIATPTAPGIEFCELQDTALHRIFLICGNMRFYGKYDQFISRVPHMLEYSLQTGDAFVFCNKSRHQLSILQWQGDGFALMFRRTEAERYPWPAVTAPKAIEITRADMEMLIEYPRFMRRLRGLATPEFLN